MKKAFSILGVLAVIVIAVAACIPYGPTVVEKLELTGQTSSITATNLYTPSDDGDYLVAAYATMPGATVDGDAEVHIGWTDEFRTYSPSSLANICDANSGTKVGYGIRIVHVAGGNPIQYSVIWGSGVNSTSYDLVITVTKL